jgi:hypothetical protein
MAGRIATAREVKARWAFSEVTSERFGGPYGSSLSQPVHQRIVAGCEFAEVDYGDWDDLIRGLNTARNDQFTENVDRHGPDGYVCADWSAEKLLATLVIPNFGEGLRYRQFLTMFPMSHPQTGAIDLHDPRFRSWAIPVSSTPSQQREPLIAIGGDPDHMLLEGYLRSILWLRNPAEPLKVRVPA